MTGRRSSLSRLPVLRCQPWHHIPKDLHKKLYGELLAIHSAESNQHKLWMSLTKKEVVSMDVTSLFLRVNIHLRVAG